MQQTESSGSIRKWQNDAGAGVASVAISDDGKRIIAGTLDNRILCLDRTADDAK